MLDKTDGGVSHVTSNFVNKGALNVIDVTPVPICRRIPPPEMALARVIAFVALDQERAAVDDGAAADRPGRPAEAKLDSIPESIVVVPV
jgi:hypothetical protein